MHEELTACCGADEPRYESAVVSASQAVVGLTSSYTLGHQFIKFVNRCQSDLSSQGDDMFDRQALSRPREAFQSESGCRTGP